MPGDLLAALCADRALGVRASPARRQSRSREWVSQKPKGYVLNTDGGLSDRSSTRLHRASCFTLEPGFGGGDRQTVDYIKVCSPDPKELDEWAVGILGYGLPSCAASTASRARSA